MSADTIRFAVSNIALSPGEHGDELRALPGMGVGGVEVAPSRIWEDAWNGLPANAVAAYQAQIEGAGLRVVGLHSLLFDQPDFGMFGETRDKTLEFLVHLSAVCRDLGGRTLIYGGGRRRGDVDADTALDIARDFVGEYCQRTVDHGTCLCFEPLGPNDTDFLNRAADCLALVQDINHPAFRLQLDAKALVENSEDHIDTFNAAAPYLVHFHANQPGLGVLQADGPVPHMALGGYLREIGYDKYVSLEQRMLNTNDPLADIAASLNVMTNGYQHA